MTRCISTCLVACMLLACPAPDDDSDDTTATLTDSGIPTLSGTTTDDSAEATSLPTTGETGETGESSTTGIAEEPPNCGLALIQARVEIPRVMLVLDKSGSMVSDNGGYWDADGDDADDDGFVDSDPGTPATPRVTRWQSLHETVQFIVGDFESRMDFGAVLFPSLAAKGIYSAAACPVSAAPDVALGPDQGAEILATIPAADSLKLAGGTPATAGMLTGIAGLATADVEEDARDKYVILVTDGAANCPLEPVDADPASLFENYDEMLPVVVADALAAEIPTFVVGIDIADVTSSSAQDGNPDATNAYQRLNDVALAGGMPREGAEKFYNTANQLELQAALMKISEQITSCVFELDKPLQAIQYLDEVIIDEDGPNPLHYDKHQVTDCASESGWHFTDPTRSAIELCGDACTLFKQTGEVELTFQCTAG